MSKNKPVVRLCAYRGGCAAGRTLFCFGQCQQDIEVMPELRCEGCRRYVSVGEIERVGARLLCTQCRERVEPPPPASRQEQESA